MANKTDLFSKLGGTRAIAERLGEPPSTVQSWKTARRIPAQKQPLIIERFAEIGISITADEVVWPMGRDEIAQITHVSDATESAAA